jgi:hypothetical protein
MIWHDDSDVQEVSDSVIMQAAAEGDVSRPVWQCLTEFCNECYEVRFIVALKMRQGTTIEGSRQELFCHQRQRSCQKKTEIC